MGFTIATLGNDTENGLHHFIRDSIRHGAAEIPRRNTIGSHIARRHFTGKRTREPPQPGLGGGIVRLARRAQEAAYRRHVDDAAVPRPQHVAHYGFAAKERRLQVRIHHRIPIRFRHADEERIPRDAGVVDEDIDLAALAVNGLHHLLDLRCFGHVRLDRAGAAALCGNVRHDSVSRLRATVVVDKDMRSILAKPRANCRAQVTRSAGDQRNPSLHSSSFIQ